MAVRVRGTYMTTLFEELTLGGELEPTATYAHRAWAWLPNPNRGKGIPGQDFDGHLSITLQKGRKAGCKIERDAYLVEVQPAVPGFIGRVFLLSNTTDPAAEEVYEVHVGVREGEQSCTCPAGKYRAASDKHIDALRAAIAAGAFTAKQASPEGRGWDQERESESEEYEMLYNQQTAGGQQRNDEDYSVPTAVYLCQFTGDEEIKPKPGDETETPRIVFEFVIADGPYKGKKINTFVRKNLFPGNAKGAKPSHLYKMARSLGAPDPMNFDTKDFIGRYYTIVAKNENGQRAWPDSIIPAQQPAGSPSAPPPPAVYPPPPSSAPADESRWQVWDAQNKSWMVATGKEIRHFLTLPGYSAGSLMVTPDGSRNILTAAAHGFLVAAPSSPDLPPPPSSIGGESSGIPY